MKRILIIGNAGAGKTTFARILASKYQLPLIHLDRLYWQDNWQHLSSPFTGMCCVLIKSSICACRDIIK